MSQIEQWYAEQSEALRRVGITDVEPLPQGEKRRRLFFSYRGARFTMAVDLYDKKLVPVIGVVALPPSGAPRRRVARLPFAIFRAMTERDRKGVALGLNRAIRIGDPAFDERIYVETDAVEGEIEALLASPDARAALTTLLGDQKVVSVRFAEHDSLVTLFTHPYDAQQLPALLDTLGWLATGLPQPDAAPSPDKGSLRAQNGLAILLMVSLFVWCVPCFVGLELSPFYGPFWIIATIASLLAFGLAALICLLSFRGRTTGYRFFVTSFICFAFLVPSIVVTSLLLLNDLLPSERRTRAAMIEDVRCGTTRSRIGESAWCHVQVRMLDDGEVYTTSEMEKVTLDGGASVVGRCGPATLIERRGGLGFPLLVALWRTPNGEHYYTRCASD